MGHVCTMQHNLIRGRYIPPVHNRYGETGGALSKARRSFLVKGSIGFACIAGPLCIAGGCATPKISQTQKDTVRENANDQLEAALQGDPRGVDGLIDIYKSCRHDEQLGNELLSMLSIAYSKAVQNNDFEMAKKIRDFLKAQNYAVPE